MNKELFKNLKDKKVLLTGHTGFKGAYMIVLLKYFGAKVYGYALDPGDNSLYNILNLKDELEGEVIADIRDEKKLYNFVDSIKPDYIIHMAAQALVLKSYDIPKDTYEINVMGTVNLLEAIRKSNDSNLKSFINVTTDKVYENNDDNVAFAEDMKLCGFDPYANSKSCSDIITYSYKHSFFEHRNFAVNICRAGNVIGGGDMSENRILPDLYKAALKKEKAFLRMPESTRPYQYVLEPLISYLYIVLSTEQHKEYEGAYNVGPDKSEIVNNKKLSELFYKYWGEELKENYVEKTNARHEAKYLRLDNKKLKDIFKIDRMYTVDEAVKNTVEVYKALRDKRDIKAIIIHHIEKVL